MSYLGGVYCPVRPAPDHRELTWRVYGLLEKAVTQNYLQIDNFIAAPRGRAPCFVAPESNVRYRSSMDLNKSEVPSWEQEDGWTDIGGDLEAKWDGAVYVDIRNKGTHERFTLSPAALKKALALTP